MAIAVAVFLVEQEAGHDALDGKCLNVEISGFGVKTPECMSVVARERMNLLTDDN